MFEKNATIFSFERTKNSRMTINWNVTGNISPDSLSRLRRSSVSQLHVKGEGGKVSKFAIVKKKIVDSYTG